MKLQPLEDQVLVELDDATETFAGSVLVKPVTAKRDGVMIIGTVLAVGPGKRTDAGVRIEPAVQVGDRVVVPKWVGHAWEGENVRTMGKEQRLMPVGELLAVVLQ